MNRGIGPRRTAGHNAVRSALAALMAVSMLAIFVGSTVAHTPQASLSCRHGLEVDLLYYEPAGTNTVDVSIDGVAVDGSPFTFSDTFQKHWSSEDA